MSEIVAKRGILAQGIDGKIFSTAVEIGKPYRTEEGEWFCNLRIEGVNKHVCVAGIDSLQAIMLTMSLAECILLSRVEKGWQFFWPDTNELMEIEEMFNLKNFASIRK